MSKSRSYFGVLCFDHDSKQRFRTGRSNQDTPAAFNLTAAQLNSPREFAVILPVIARRESLVNQHLRH